MSMYTEPPNRSAQPASGLEVSPGRGVRLDWPQLGGSGKDVMPKYIDPDLPFTEGEVRRGFRLAGASAAEARALARQVAQLPQYARDQSAQAEVAHRRGSTGPAEINDASWQISDEFLAILAWASPELAARVERFIDARWEEWTQAEIRAAMARRRIAGELDPPRDVLVAARGKVAPWKAGWTRKPRRIARALADRAAEEVDSGDAGHV